MLQKFNRGDVYFYNFGHEYSGSVEAKTRPCVIISNDKGNTYGPTVLVAPITTRSKESCNPWQVHFQNGEKSQIILCEQIQTVNSSNLYRYQGKLDELTMRAVDKALAVEFGLNVTQREQDSTEFLHRLDVALNKIINKRLDVFETKVNETISTTISNTFNIKREFQNSYNTIMTKLSSIHTDNSNVSVDINDIKNMFNKNADNLDKILNTLISLYKDIDSRKIVPLTESSSMLLDVSNIDFKDNIKQDNEQSTNIDNTARKRQRYSVDYAKEFIEDYYHNLNKNEFMSKYNISDAKVLAQRLYTIKKVLKRNNINWEHLRDKLTIYNINDLSEEEKQNRFSKYLKNNETLAKVNQSSTSDEGNKVFNNKTKKRNSNWQPRINYENVQELLDFINECNNSSTSEICDKYGLTTKQLSNRKYLIMKSLKDRNIPFNNKKSRKDV